MSIAKRRVSTWMKIKKRSMNKKSRCFVCRTMDDVCILDMVNVYCCCFFRRLPWRTSIIELVFCFVFNWRNKSFEWNSIRSLMNTFPRLRRHRLSRWTIMLQGRDGKWSFCLTCSWFLRAKHEGVVWINEAGKLLSGSLFFCCAFWWKEKKVMFWIHNDVVVVEVEQKRIFFHQYDY